MTILERLRAATGPDRELDIAIFKFQRPEYADYVEGRGGLVHVCDGSDQRVLSDVRPDNFTASIAAALALVEQMLPGSEYSISKTLKDGRNWHKMTLTSNNRWFMRSATATTAPLAILTVLFTALEAEEKSNDT